MTRPVTIVGKCAAEVVIENPGDKRAGILVTSATGVVVRGVTLKGHTTGVYVKGAGDVTVEDSILDANKWMGLYVLTRATRSSFARASRTPCPTPPEPTAGEPAHSKGARSSSRTAPCSAPPAKASS